MQAEDLIFNHSSEREVVKQGSEDLPNFRVAVFTQALIIEAIPK